MLQLNDLLPPSKWEPNWTIYGALHEGLSDDAEYVVFEYYCEKPACDCKNLTAEIMKMGHDGRHIEKSLAVISYDWSTTESACKPTLHSKSPRTQLALHLLKAYKSFVHNEEYVARIQNEYSRVKELASSKLDERKIPKKNQSEKNGRNDPCGCGSGKKYKKCCLVR